MSSRLDEKLPDPTRADRQQKQVEEVGFSAVFVEPPQSQIESYISSEEGTKQVQTPDLNIWIRLQQFRQAVTKIVSSTEFELGVSFVIVLNLVTIGIQAELDLNSAQLPWMTSVERSFLFVYSVEATLRFVAKGPKIFCNPWLLGQFMDVWRLVYGIVNSSLTIVSSAMLAFLLLYIFGCMAIEFISKDEKLASIGDEGNGNVAEIVAQNFGSLPRAMLTLLQFMTLDSIAGIYFPLIMAKPVLFFFFAPILWLMGVALMNLVAAIFVENALQLAEEEADLQSNRTKQKAKDALPELLAAFQRLNLGSNGRLTEEEFARLPIEMIPVKDLKKLSMTDMTQLFQLLDVDGRGILTQSELVDSLLDFVVLDVPMWSLKSLRFLRMINDRVAKIEGDVDRIHQSAFDATMM